MLPSGATAMAGSSCPSIRPRQCSNSGRRATGGREFAHGTKGPGRVLRGYYLVRPALPRRLQLRLRRAFTRVQARSSFPGWPAEDSLHALYAWLFGLLAELAGEPVPYIGPWPHGKSWALVLTHDVETDSRLP